MSDATTAPQTPDLPKDAPTTAETKKPSVSDRKLEAAKAELSLEKTRKVSTEATSIFDPIAYEQLKRLAADLIAGGAASPDAKTAEQLLVKLQAGFELGMTPVQSQNSLYIVNGRTTIWGSALIARLRQQGWSVRFTDEDATECTIVVTKIGGDENGTEISDTFQFMDAVESGYTGLRLTDDGKVVGEPKVGWRPGQNRKLKMRYGAAAQLVKTYLPEVLNGNNIGVAEIDQDAPLIVDNEAETPAERQERVKSALADYKATAPTEAEFTPKAVTRDES